MPALLNKNLLRELDLTRLPNAKHLQEKFLKAPFDHENRFSLPYFWGTVAVGLRIDHVQSTVRGFEVLLDEQYAGRITMLDDPEHVVAAMLLHLGLPMNSVEPDHLGQVQKLLALQKPLVQAYTSDAYKERLIAGQAWAAMGWSGDLCQAAAEASDVRVVIPATGTMIWMDSMAIPRGAEEVELAHAFLDFLLEPEVAARNAAAVRFATPNQAALDRLPPSCAAMRASIHRTRSWPSAPGCRIAARTSPRSRRFGRPCGCRSRLPGGILPCRPTPTPGTRSRLADATSIQAQSSSAKTASAASAN
jgi:spermidine/putrescine-binding protein